ncbi:MFS family permease [Nocardioides aromaticivorans]|uniref:MFS family permease n=1 Tax=Nocardioides aromaticivorans TaxID=200618 RepID=A0A7Y9ZJK1_9ACTN|nr:MFS transporter [Nocardioides aromaticivorans]NYI45543.1 MFS family permease [Nocardioides aromaticivorans]
MSRYISDRIARLAGPTPLVRRLSAQSVLSAFGDGVFLTGSAVFFTQIVGLSAARVGLGLSIAGAVTFLLAVPLGKLSDRFGAKRVWALASLVEALLYLAWLAVGGFATFVAMLVVLELVVTTSRSARNAYRFDIFPREERVSSNAYFRAARNVGYTLGALLAGVALATNDDAMIRAVPVATAALLVLNAVLVSRMPSVIHHTEEAPLEAALETVLDGGKGDKRSALRNRGYVAMAVLGGVLGTHQVLLNVVIPLWLVEETDAPRVLLAWLFGTNTVMAVLLQVAAARGITTVADSLRAQRRGAFFFVLSCGIVLVTHDTVGWVTIVLVWVGHVTVTGAELFQSAGEWGLQAELSDPARRGEYQGVSQLGYTLGTVWAPALYTFLAMHWGAQGWLVIAAIVLLAAVLIHPAARAAERHLTRMGVPAPEPA